MIKNIEVIKPDNEVIKPNNEVIKPDNEVINSLLNNKIPILFIVILFGKLFE
jgi:hypothetical protein